MDREREHLLGRNDNSLSPYGSELHILTYKIYKLRHLVEVPSSPTIRNEKLLIVGTLVLTIAVGFGVHYLPFWDSLPSLLSGFLKGFVTIVLIVGIIWAGNRFFGLFREIDKESSGSPDKR